MLRTIARSQILQLMSNRVLFSSQKVVGVKKLEDLKINLVDDKRVYIIHINEAKRISEQKNMKLVKILDYDVASKRPIYKLMTKADYLEEQLKSRLAKKEARKIPSIKGEKLITITAKIGENDLEVRLKNICKWLSKYYEVRIVVHGYTGQAEALEKIFQHIEAQTKEFGKIVQKRIKENDLKFQIIPNLTVKEKADESGNDSKNDEIASSDASSKSL